MVIWLRGNVVDKDLKIVEFVDMDEFLIDLLKVEWFFIIGGLVMEILFGLLFEKVKLLKMNEWIDYFYFVNCLFKLYCLLFIFWVYLFKFEKKVDVY